MITVLTKDKLYLPTYTKNFNGTVTSYDLESCMAEDETGTYIFPIYGAVGEYYRYLNSKKHWYELKDAKNDLDLYMESLGHKYWFTTYSKVMEDGSLKESPFELVHLRKLSVSSISFCWDDNDKPSFHDRSIVPRSGSVSVRSSDLAIESRFLGAYHVSNDIPLSIDVACVSCGRFGFEGNYAIIDLKKWREDEKLVYELS